MINHKFVYFSMINHKARAHTHPHAKRHELSYSDFQKPCDLEAKVTAVAPARHCGNWKL